MPAQPFFVLFGPLRIIRGSHADGTSLGARRPDFFPIVGTMLSANVFFVIIPSQRKMGGAMAQGEVRNPFTESASSF